MKLVPDGVGTAPIGVRLSPDGETVYVANYLARNVAGGGGATPLDATRQSGELPLRVAADPHAAVRNNDCPAGTGFCNHPGGGGVHRRTPTAARPCRASASRTACR